MAPSRLLLAALLLVLPPPSRAALIASSKLEQCFNDGLGPLDCQQQITVALAIASGQLGTEELHTCMDESNEERELEAPIRLSISKSEAIVRYPVTYLQSFNSAPFEVVTHHGLGGCKDGDQTNAPSCGWVLGTDGARVPDSQGFCCSCSFNQLLGMSTTSKRQCTDPRHVDPRRSSHLGQWAGECALERLLEGA